MIRKNTKAIFEDGEYAGTYDWQGGIPLSVGECMEVNVNDKKIQYKLIDKKVSYNVEGEDQIANIIYSLKELRN